MPITQPQDLAPQQTVNMMIYGQPGVGKTTVALSMPNPVLLDFDKGLRRVDVDFRVPSLQVEGMNEVYQAINSGELSPFGTIVIDTLGKFVDAMIVYMGQQNPKYVDQEGQPNMKGWGSLKVNCNKFFKLINSQGKSVIIVAHEKEDKDGDHIIKRPDAVGSTKNEVIKDMDLVGYMEMVGNKRTIAFQPHQRYVAKNSLRMTNKIDVPDTEGGNDFLQKAVLAVIQKRQQQESEQAAPRAEARAKMKAAIDDVVGTETANAALAAILEVDAEMPDVAKPYKLTLMSKAKAMDCMFDAETKQFKEVV